MMCVYCGTRDGLLIVDKNPESVGCFEHLASVVTDRMVLDGSASVIVERVG